MRKLRWQPSSWSRSSWGKEGASLAPVRWAVSWPRGACIPHCARSSSLLSGCIKEGGQGDLRFVPLLEELLMPLSP